MKEKITRFNLEDAFKALDDIEYSKTDVVESKSLHERFVRNDKTEVLMEEYYNVSSTQDLEEARDDREDDIAKAKLAKIEKIVDLDAESPEDIQPSYIGKTIIQCPQCMTLFYKDPADVVASEDDPETVNVGEVCQHCGNKEGYSIIGKVGEVTPEEAEQFEDDVPAEEEAPAEELPSSEEVPEEEPSEEAAEEPSAEEDELPNLEEPSDEEELTESKNILEEQVKNALTEEVEEEPAEEPAEGEEAELEAEEPAEEVTFDQNEVKDVAAEVAEKVAPKEDAEVVADAVDEVVDAAVEAKLEAEEPAEEPVEEVDESEEVEELNEDVKADDLNKKLKEHNEYIATLQDEIKKEEEAVNNAKNEFIKKLHENNLESLQDALDKAIPEEVKAESAIDDLPTPEEAAEELPESEGELNEELSNESKMPKKLDGVSIEDIRREANLTEKLRLAGKVAMLDDVARLLHDDLSKLTFIKQPIEVATSTNSYSKIFVFCFKKDFNFVYLKVCNILETAGYLKYELSYVEDTKNEAVAIIIDKIVPGETERIKYNDNNSEEKKQYVSLEESAEANETLTEGILDKVKGIFKKKSKPADAKDETDVDANKGQSEESKEEPVENKDEKPKDEAHKISESVNDVTDAEIKELFGSEEFNEPISDEEVDKIIADEKLTECNKSVFEEVEDFDEESLNKCVSEALTEVYSNVENFKMTECSLTDNSLVVEGKINFKSGKQRDTSFVFTEGKDAKIICGINEDLDKSGSFNISYSIDNKKMFTESLNYSYHINENLVEGIANR